MGGPDLDLALDLVLSIFTVVIGGVINSKPNSAKPSKVIGKEIPPTDTLGTSG